MKRTSRLRISPLAHDDAWCGGEEAFVLAGTDEKRDNGEGDSLEDCELIVVDNEERRNAPRHVSIRGPHRTRRHLAYPKQLSRALIIGRASASVLTGNLLSRALMTVPWPYSLMALLGILFYYIILVFAEDRKYGSNF